MTKISKKLKLWAWFLALPLLQWSPGNVSAQRQPAAAKSSFVSWTAPAKGDISGYTGTKSCIDCHKSRVTQTSKTVHSHAAVAGTEIGTSCEACHGPGKEHTDRENEAERTKTKDPAAAKLIFSFNRSPEANSAPCLACHNSSKDHDLFTRSEHKLQAVACNECHAAHLVFGSGEADMAKSFFAVAKLSGAPALREETRWLNESLLRTSQQELCVSCHRSIEAQFSLPTRHRVLDGFMKCTDCHNAHGSLTKPLLKQASNYDTCVSCHPEKRGPFVYEHAAVKVEGCTSCHTPHGSVNQHLLVRGETRFLCQSCHGGHGALGYQASGQCTRCHVAIHGSNTSAQFVK